MLDFMEELYKSCHESFGATTGAWELVCHCLEKLFTEEFKPSLKLSIEQDLVDSRSAFIGVMHTAFSLNVKVRELTTVGLKNHHSTTTSHVRFVMKMASNQRKGDDNTSLMAKYDTLKKDHEATKKTNRALESRIDKLMTWAEKTGGKKLD
jgi:predicted  nucleic acid-binding Zn-ribbon protein